MDDGVQVRGGGEERLGFCAVGQVEFVEFGTHAGDLGDPVHYVGP